MRPIEDYTYCIKQFKRLIVNHFENRIHMLTVTCLAGNL